MKTTKPKEPARQKTPSETDHFYDDVAKAIDDLARQRLVVDSGRRRWSEHSGRYEIVWIAAKDVKK